MVGMLIKINFTFEKFNFILLINVKMPSSVGILIFISMINTTSERLNIKQETSLFVGTFVF